MPEAAGVKLHSPSYKACMALVMADSSPTGEDVVGGWGLARIVSETCKSSWQRGKPSYPLLLLPDWRWDQRMQSLKVEMQHREVLYCQSSLEK